MKWELEIVRREAAQESLTLQAKADIRNFSAKKSRQMP